MRENSEEDKFIQSEGFINAKTIWPLYFKDNYKITTNVVFTSNILYQVIVTKKMDALSTLFLNHLQ